MPILTPGEIARICSGRVVGDEHVAVMSVVGDSREVTAESAFVAIRGGHRFVQEALRTGAPFAIVDHADALPEGATGVVVGDAVRAIAQLAKDVRSRLRAKAVGITGSTGKTLTKDFTAAALGPRYRVHAAPRSFNTEVGVPLVILDCPDDAEILVLELGARHPGEIAELAEIARCEIGVVTGIGMTHLGEFRTRDAIARTKAELLRSLPPSGLAIVPADDDYLPLLTASTSARVATVGPGGTTRFSALELDQRGRTVGNIYLNDLDLVVTLPMPGRALMRNAAVAVRIAFELGVDIEEAVRAIADSRPTSSRMDVSALGPWTLVNDAYNANPVSTASALRTVRELAGAAPAWAVLGEMAELGSSSEDEHARIGRLAGSLGYAGVIAVGSATDALSRAAAPIAVRVDSNADAAEAVLEFVPEGGFVLVKGSLVTNLKEFGELLAGRLKATRSGRS